MTEQFFLRWRNNGDERAAVALYRSYHKDVYRLAYALLGDVDDAEEVMQDTMVQALTRVNHYDSERASFSTWLHTITVSRCRDLNRQKRPAKAPPGSTSESHASLIDATLVPDGRTTKRESHLELWQALDQLSPKLREAIILRYWCDHTYQEMAQIMRCPLPTAQSRVRSAYEQLRTLLAPAGVTASGGENLR